MPKTHAFTESQQKEVEWLLQKTTDTKLYKKLEVLKLRIEGYKNAEISKITGYSKSRTSALVCIYANKGIDYFKKEHRLGGNRRNIPYEEEAKLLSAYEQSARNGNIITVGEVKKAYDEKCGHKSGPGTIYKILKRHKWRKVMPRSKHPKKASDEAIEASKKLTLNTKN